MNQKKNERKEGRKKGTYSVYLAVWNSKLAYIRVFYAERIIIIIYSVLIAEKSCSCRCSCRCRATEGGIMNPSGNFL